MENFNKTNNFNYSKVEDLSSEINYLKIADEVLEFTRPIKKGFKQPPIKKEKLILVPSPERTKTGKHLRVDRRVVQNMPDHEKRRFDAALEKSREDQIEKRRRYKYRRYEPQVGPSEAPTEVNYTEEWLERVIFANFTEAETTMLEHMDVFVGWGPLGVAYVSANNGYPPGHPLHFGIHRTITRLPNDDIYTQSFLLNEAEVAECRARNIPTQTLHGQTRPKFVHYSLDLPKDHPMHIDNKKLRFCYPAPVQNATSEQEDSQDYVSSLASSWEPQAGLFQFGIDEESRNLIEGLARTVSDVSDRMDNVSLKVTADATVTTIVSEFSMVLLIVALLCVVKPKTQNEKIAMSMMVMGFLMSKGNLMEVISSSGLLQWLKKPFVQGDSFVPQSGSLEETAVLVSGLLSTYLCVQSGASIFDAKELIRVIGACGRMKMGVKSVTDALGLITNYIHATLEHWFAGTPYYVKCGHDFIDAFLIEAKQITTMAENHELHNLQSSVDRVTKCIELGESVAIKIPATQDLVGLRMHVVNVLAEMRKIKKALLASNFKFSGIRVEPVGIMLRGPPGVGKSQAMQHIADAINAMTLSDVEFELYKENRGSHIWNRQAENEYWDGYTSNMNVVFYDDILQVRDTQGVADGEAMGTIRNINVFENQLHCAAMESKGTTNFRSKFVISTTNMVNFKFESITEPGAFLRRWDIVVDVIPKAEYCVDIHCSPWKRRFDKSKLPIFTESDLNAEKFPHLLGATRIHPSMCEYHLQRMTKSEDGFESAGQVIQYSDLIKRIYSVHMQKVLYNQVYLKELDDTLFLHRKEKVEPQVGGPHWQQAEFTEQLSDESLNGPNDLMPDENTPVFMSQEQFVQWQHLANTDADTARYILALTRIVMARGLANGYYWPHVEIVDFINELDIKLQEPYALVGYGTLQDDVDRVFLGLCMRPQSGFAHGYAKTYARIELAKKCLQEVKTVVPRTVQNLADIMRYTFSYCLYMGNSAIDYAGSFTPSKMLSIVGNSPTIKATIIGVLGAMPVIVAAVHAIRFVSNLLTNTDSEPESDERHGRLRRARVVRRPQGGAVVSSRASRNPNGFNPQSIARANENLTSIMRMLTVQNTFEVRIPVSSEEGSTNQERSLGFALGVRGRSIMMPYHFISTIASEVNNGYINGSSPIVFYRPGKKYREFSLPASEFLTCFKEIPDAEPQDLGMVKLPKRFNPVKDITYLFATKKQQEMYKKVDAVLLVPSSEAKEYHIVVADRGQNAMVESDEYHPYVVKRIFAYNAYTMNGDCGSILFVNDKTKHSTIIGMHVAGVRQQPKGFSTEVTKEFVEEYLSKLEEDYLEKDVLQVPTVDPELEPDNMIHVGNFAPQVRHPPKHSRSKIVRSPLYGKVAEVKRAPARLAPFKNAAGEYIDPMDKAIEAYCEEDVYIDPQHIDQARSSLYDMLESCSSRPVKREILSNEHAVLGDQDGDFSSIPRTTSAGYPYNCMSGPTTKVRFFGTDDTYDLTTPEAIDLFHEVDFLLDRAAEGIRIRQYFTDHLKDERRSKKKVEEGATRLISACPLALLIGFRRAFGAFSKHMIRNRIDNGCLIGINEYSEEWPQLALNFEMFGVNANNVGAGDYKGFDMRQKNPVAWAILDIINEWYGDDKVGNKIRETLWLEIVNSYHINGDRIFSWKAPLPSGAPPTTVFNCLANHMNFRLCWLRLCPQLTAHDFNKYVYLAVLGDDNAFSVHPDVLHLFNEKNLQRAMASIGQVYTPEDKNKTEFSDTMRNLSEITLLKRSFKLHDLTGRIVAPLEMDAILDLINWTQSGPNYLGDTENNCKIFLEELSLHGKETYTKWRKILMSAIEECPGLGKPGVTDYLAVFRSVQSRDRGTILETRFFTDYDELRYKNPNNQTEGGRFEEEQAGLFRPTSRMACWQPQSNPGNSGISHRLVHHEIYDSTATNSVGLTDQSAFETQRTSQTPALGGTTTSDSVDAETPITQIVKYVPLNSSLLDSARTGASIDIASFLAKPVNVFSGLLTTSDTYGTFKWVAVTPQDFTNGTTIWKNKLAGTLAFKGDLHLTVILNATRMQQGRYMLCWVPSGGAVNFDKWYRMHAATLTQATQLPHVEMDVSCDTEATLIIPHITAQGWAAFEPAGGSFFGNNGVVFFTTYSPLEVSTGSISANYNIMAHWENVELAMPFTPQSGIRTKTRVKRRVKASEEEQISQDIGPISSVLSRVSTTANTLAGIPLLTSIAKPVGWATDILANTARSFGWSRPHNSEHTTMVTRNIVNRFTNADVADNSTKLGIFDNNEIEDLPGFAGTDLDEMDLNFVASISAYFASVRWNSSATTGTQLLQYDCNPRNNYSGTTTNGFNLIHLCPVSFVTNFFALYRGSLKFTFKLVKTEFHTGRLALSFYPKEYGIGAFTVPNFTNTAYLHREIIDVREGNEFSFIVPFVSFTPFRSTQGLDATYGQILLHVVNPLVAPANVPSSINILMEVAAAPDMEWAQATDFSGSVTQIYTPQAGNVCEITQGIIGGSKIYEDRVAARLCIGERVRSFRTLLKRFNTLLTTSVPTLNKFITMWPFVSEVGFVDTAVTMSYVTRNQDTYAILQSVFALSRGGVRIKVVPLEAGGGISIVNANTEYYSSVPTGVIAFAAAASSASVMPAYAVFRTEGNGGSEVEFPYYNRTHSTPCADVIHNTSAATTAIKSTAAGCVPRVSATISNVVNYTLEPKVMRAASEDHSFGLFVSVPPLYGWNA